MILFLSPTPMLTKILEAINIKPYLQKLRRAKDKWIKNSDKR